ncbi:MAG: HAMP domain-containing sensor histidine kinase [Bacteroidota bacterium]
MKIRERLALFTTVLAWTLLLALSWLVYFFSAQHERSEFTQRLRERVEITEQLFVEAEYLDSTMLADIRGKFLNTLPEEIEEVFEVPPQEDVLIAQLSQTYPPEFVHEIFEDTSATFFVDGRQGVGKWFRREEGGVVVVVTAVDVYGNRQLNYLWRVFVVGLLVSLLLLFPLVWWYVKGLLLPIEEKIDRAREISATNLHLRLPVENEQDEMGQLAMTFNAMLDRLERAFQSQRQFVSNASHELKNPLTAIIGQAEVSLEKGREPAEYQMSLRLIQEESTRLRRLVDNLLGLATADFDPTQLRPDPIRLDELVLELIAQHHQVSPGCLIEFRLPEELEDPDVLCIQGNQALLTIGISNLLDNAIKYSNGTKVLVELKWIEKQVVLLIQDQGIGILAEDLPFVTEPLYRGENARNFRGFGMGLSLTQRILDLHQANLQLTSQAGEGTQVRLTF